MEGFSSNPSIDIEFILIFTFYLIDQSLDTMEIKESSTADEFTLLHEYELSADDMKKYDM